MKMPNMQQAAKRTSNPEYLYENRTNQKIFLGKKYYIRTYGCQMNVHDSEEIKGLLETLGYLESKDMQTSDLIILNTCAIRENANEKVFGFLGRLKHQKQSNPELIIGVCGCMPQLESVASEIKEKHSYIDIVFGTHNMNELPSMLINHSSKLSMSIYSKEGDVIEFDNLYKRDSKISAWVNVMYGCDKFCTYCIVPYTRGKERSRKYEDILKEVRQLVDLGYKEITLLGQNVNAYGKDLHNSPEFGELLEMVSMTGINRIRFVTSHPWDFTDEMLEVISKYENIMPYIHLPVQSGSDRILKLMNRKYTKSDYLELFAKIRQKIKNVSITTDIIVGFPGETKEDFNETINLVNECKFDGAYTFIFSPRNHTPASKMLDNISLEEKKTRLQKLNKIVNSYSKESNIKLLGTVQNVLLTSVSPKNKEVLSGYTENMKLVNIKASQSYIGQVVKAEIIAAKSFSLDGKLLV